MSNLIEAINAAVAISVAKAKQNQTDLLVRAKQWIAQGAYHDPDSGLYWARIKVTTGEYGAGQPYIDGPVMPSDYRKFYVPQGTPFYMVTKAESDEAKKAAVTEIQRIVPNGFVCVREYRAPTPDEVTEVFSAIGDALQVVGNFTGLQILTLAGKAQNALIDYATKLKTGEPIPWIGLPLPASLQPATTTPQLPTPVATEFWQAFGSNPNPKSRL